MKLLIIGPRSYENLALREAGEKLGHAVLLTSIQKISFMVEGDEMKAYYQGQGLSDFEVCLFRGIKPFFAKAKTLAKYLHNIGTTVIDKELYNEVYEFDKMFMTFNLFQKKLPCIDSFHFSNEQELNRYMEKIPRPVFIKDIEGMHSRNLYYFETKKELQEFFSQRSHAVKQFLIQRVVKNDFYIRVLVIGGRALGAMQRMTFLNENRLKIPISQRSKPMDLSPELRELAIRAAKAVNADIAGVDIIYDQGRPKLLEVNRSPKFQRFTKVMKIKVAEEIINYLEKERGL